MNTEETLRDRFTANISKYPNAIATVLREMTIEVEKIKIAEALKNPWVMAVYKGIINESIEKALEGRTFAQFRYEGELEKWEIKAIINKLEEAGFKEVIVNPPYTLDSGRNIQTFTIKW